MNGPNRMMGRPTIDSDGNVTFVAAATLMAGPGFGYLLVQAPRADVKTINGQPFPPDSVLSISAENSADQGGLRRMSPRHHIYSYTNDQLWLQFSFDGNPFEDGDVLAAVGRRFKYSTVEVRFPEKATDNSRTYAQLRGPLRDLDLGNMKQLKLSFTGFEGRRLQGRIEGTIVQLTTRTEDPSLITGDIAGVGHTSRQVSIPFVVDFDLSVD